MAITYDVTNNIITVIGYTEGTPCDCSDLYDADKAGTLSLEDRDGLSSVDGAPVAVDHALCPADYRELGGACNDLYIVIENWVGVGTVSIEIVGTDRCGNAVSEVIAVTGDGTSYLTKKYATITTTQITIIVVGNGSPTFDYELIQGQWGVVWKNGLSGTYEKVQYRLDSKLYIGDGDTASWFADTRKEIFFYDAIAANGQSAIVVYNNAHFRLGEIGNEDLKTCGNGCSLYVHADVYYGYIYGGLQSDIKLYDSKITATYYTIRFRARGTFRAWHTSFERMSIYWCPSADLYEVGIGLMAYAFETTSGTMEEIRIWGASYALYGWGNKAFVVRNVVIRGCTNDVLGVVITTDKYLINVDSERDDWLVVWSGTNTAKFYRQYELDIHVCDYRDGSHVEGATVTLYDKDDVEVFSVTTDANGDIETQTVTYGYYDQAGASVMYEKSPHKLVISKAGYQTEVDIFNMDSKKVLQISLQKAIKVFINVGKKMGGKPLINLKPSDPENKNVIAL